MALWVQHLAGQPAKILEGKKGLKLGAIWDNFGL